MKKYLWLLLVGLIFSFNLASAQPDVPPATPVPDGYMLVKATDSLTRFDLNFSGGTPRNLVDAIEKATGKPLNVVIPKENADLKIPAISVKNVTVAQLFEVLKDNSVYHKRSVWRAFSDSTHQETLSNPITYYEREVTCGFQTSGVPNDNSIWYLYSDGDVVQAEPQVCRFFLLTPYLNAGYTVEDITTTVKKGWKMLGAAQPPEIDYNKDTKVLVAVGEIDKVDLIGDLLNQLPKDKPNGKELARSGTSKD